MKLVTLISIISFIFSNEHNNMMPPSSSPFYYQSNTNIEIEKENIDQSENKKSDKKLVNTIFNITDKLENILYLGLGLGSILWIFLDSESEFYHNKYTEYKDIYEFNNGYNGYLNKYESYHSAAEISKYITVSSTMLLIFNKLYKNKKSKEKIDNNQLNKEP